MPETPAKRQRSEGREIDEAANYEEIPREFFCPISEKFMSDPVRIPASDLTYNRDSVKDLHRPEDMVPDLRRREMMMEWFSHCDLEPAFNFISNQDELVAATKSVLEQRSEDILREFATVVKYKLSLLHDGAIRCVATLLSRPCPPDSWVVATLSILAHYIDENDYMLVPEGIHPEYSLLWSISKALNSQDEEFQKGLINLIGTLVEKSPDLSVLAPKLWRILQTLISYLWPIRGHLVGCYANLLLIMINLAAKWECSESLINGGLIDLAFVLLDFGVSTPEEMISNPDQLSALRVLGSFVNVMQTLLNLSCTKLLEMLCDESEEVRTRIRQMNEEEVIVLNRVIAQADNETFNAAINVLAYYTT